MRVILILISLLAGVRRSRGRLRWIAKVYTASPSCASLGVPGARSGPVLATVFLMGCSNSIPTMPIDHVGPPKPPHKYDAGMGHKGMDLVNPSAETVIHACSVCHEII